MSNLKKTMLVIVLITIFCFISTGSVLADVEHFAMSQLDFVDLITEDNDSINRIAIDSVGNIYLTVSDKSFIKKYDNTGTLKATWGSTDGSSSSDDGKFNNPEGLIVNNEDGTDYIYVADTGNARIQKLNTSGEFEEKYNHASYKPCDVAFDSTGKLHAIFPDASWGNKLMKLVDTINNEWENVPGLGMGEDEATISENSDLIITKTDDIYITNGGEIYRKIDEYEENCYVDENNNSVCTQGDLLYSYFGLISKWVDVSHYIKGMYVDNDNNKYLIYDSWIAGDAYRHIMKYDSSFQIVDSYGGIWSKTEEALLESPSDIELDSNGNIFVVDKNKIKLLDIVSPSVKFSPNGNDTYEGNYHVNIDLEHDYPSSGDPDVCVFQYEWSTTSGPIEFDPDKTFDMADGVSTNFERFGVETCYLHVKVEDKAGNETVTVSDGYKIDKKGPDTTLTPNEGPNERLDYEVNISISDDNELNMSTLKYVCLLDGDKIPPEEAGWYLWPNTTETSIKVKLSEAGATENETYCLWVYAEDEFGNDTQFESGRFEINKTIEPITITTAGVSANIDNDTEYNQDYNIEISTISGSDVKIYYQWTDSEDPPNENSENWIETDGNGIKYGEKYSGTKYLHVKSVVDGDNYYAKRELLFDNDAPTIIINPEISTIPKNSVSTTVQANDNIDNHISEYYVKWMLKNGLSGNEDDWNESISLSDDDITSEAAIELGSSDGRYILFVKAIDKVGNVVVKHSGEFVIDNTSPTGSVNIENTIVTTSAVTVTLVVSDNISNSDNIEYIYSTDNGVNWNEQWIPVSDGLELTLTSNEKNQDINVQVKYKDEAENISEIYSVSKTIQYNPEGAITWIEYSTTYNTNEDVVATLKCNGEIEILNNSNSDTHTFKENGVFYFEIKDKTSDSIRKVKAQVYNIDKEVLVPEIIKSTTLPTNESVTVILKTREEINILNNDGSLGYLFTSLDNESSYENDFTGNGIYTLNLEDNLGNATNVAIEIDNIDKTPPVLSCTKSAIVETTESVKVEIIADEPIIIINNLGSNRKTFDENGSFAFKAQDYAGNASEITVTVDNIDREPPNVWIEYSNSEWTNESVTATIMSNEEFTVVNNEGSNKYIFNDNGRFYFKVEDNAGNQIMTEAFVSNIDKIKPRIVFTGEEHAVLIKDGIEDALNDYAAYDYISGNITDEVVVDKTTLDISTEGTYEVIYTVSDEAGNICQVNREVTVISSNQLKIYIKGVDLDQDEIIKIHSKQIDLSIFNNLGSYKIKWKNGEHLANSMKYNSNIVEGQAFYVEDRGWYTIYFQDQERNTKLVQIYAY